MIHRKAGRYDDQDKIQNIKKVNETKVLGYQFNRNTNCQAHIRKIKEKIKKVHMMLFLAGKNELDKWKRLYIFMQYMMSLLYYGSHQLLVCKNTRNKMEQSVDFHDYKAIIVK